MLKRRDNVSCEIAVCCAAFIMAEAYCAGTFTAGEIAEPIAFAALGTLVRANVLGAFKVDVVGPSVIVIGLFPRLVRSPHILPMEDVASPTAFVTDPHISPGPPVPSGNPGPPAGPASSISLDALSIFAEIPSGETYDSAAE